MPTAAYTNRTAKNTGNAKDSDYKDFSVVVS